MVHSSSSATAELIPKNLTAQEYAHELHREYLAELIAHRLELPSYEQRFFRVLQTNDIRLCDKFLHRLLNDDRQQSYAIQGFFISAQLGSVRLLDYFLTRWKINLNTQRIDHEQYSTTALLTAITYRQNEAAKFLLFRHADPSIKGKYDNALVTALHYHLSNDLLRLLLDKHVDLTSRHPDHAKFNLREYCILTNRVQAKAELDAYIIRLISQGNYSRLKWLVDHGYQCINVNITTKRNGKQLARERYYDRIVKLIEDVEYTQRKAKIKMNY